MLNISALQISFPGNEVIKGVDFCLNKGESNVILGRNGSGKSVILKAVAGLLENYGGTIAPTAEKTEIVKGYVFQKGGLFDSMNLFDNIAFGLRRRGLSEEFVLRKVKDALEKVGLSGTDEKYPSELSGGMQKRAGLARAICMEPDLLIYDDPTAGLDPILSDSIADLMLEINRLTGAASLIATHDLNVAQRTANYISLLYDGKFVFNGSSSDFFSGGNPFAVQFINGDADGPMNII